MTALLVNKKLLTKPAWDKFIYTWYLTKNQVLINWNFQFQILVSILVPRRGPGNLIGYSVSAKEVNITWRLIPREYAQGIIKGYRVYYDDKLRHSGNVSMPSSQTHLLLGGLMSYTQYNISVAGFTKFGEGPRTSVLIETDEGGTGSFYFLLSFQFYFIWMLYNYFYTTCTHQFTMFSFQKEL